MATYAATTHRLREARPAVTAWPLYLMLAGFPIWWALGAAYFVWPLLTFPLLLSLMLRRHVIVPHRFGIWLLFLAWIVLSAARLDESSGYVAFLWRLAMYVSATILFLYVLNLPRRHVSDRHVIVPVLLFWVAVVIGGFLGVFLPNVSFSTPVEAAFPARLLSDQFIRYMVHPGFSEVMTFLGYPVGRPKTFFAYSNQWGAAIAVLTPVALASLAIVRTHLARRAIQALLVLSIVPIVTSLNRGLWLALGAGLAYAVFRLTREGNFRSLGVGVLSAAIGLMLVFSTPLGTLVSDRLSQESPSTETRRSVYEDAVTEVSASPVLGWGSPRASASDPDRPPTGTQGQFFQVLYSQGIPGAIFFVSWFAYVVARSSRPRSPHQFWLHISAVVFLILLPYYNSMPTTLHVTMIVAALIWREILDPTPSDEADRSRRHSYPGLVET
jgi:polysaccharide biosynthesis protein PslJ